MCDTKIRHSTASMPQATPEQIETVRRRRRIAPIIGRTYIAIVFVGLMFLYLSNAERLTRKVFAWSFLLEA